MQYLWGNNGHGMIYGNPRPDTSVQKFLQKTELCTPVSDAAFGTESDAVFSYSSCAGSHGKIRVIFDMLRSVSDATNGICGCFDHVVWSETDRAYLLDVSFLDDFFLSFCSNEDIKRAIDGYDVPAFDGKQYISCDRRYEPRISRSDMTAILGRLFVGKKTVIAVGGITGEEYGLFARSLLCKIYGMLNVTARLAYSAAILNGTHNLARYANEYTITVVPYATGIGLENYGTVLLNCGTDNIIDGVSSEVLNMLDFIIGADRFERNLFFGRYETFCGKYESKFSYMNLLDFYRATEQKNDALLSDFILGYVRNCLYYGDRIELPEEIRSRLERYHSGENGSGVKILDTSKLNLLDLDEFITDNETQIAYLMCVFSGTEIPELKEAIDKSDRLSGIRITKEVMESLPKFEAHAEYCADIIGKGTSRTAAVYSLAFAKVCAVIERIRAAIAEKEEKELEIDKYFDAFGDYDSLFARSARIDSELSLMTHSNTIDVDYTDYIHKKFEATAQKLALIDVWHRNGFELDRHGELAVNENNTEAILNWRDGYFKAEREHRMQIADLCSLTDKLLEASDMSEMSIMSGGVVRTLNDIFSLDFARTSYYEYAYRALMASIIRLLYGKNTEDALITEKTPDTDAETAESEDVSEYLCDEGMDFSITRFVAICRSQIDAESELRKAGEFKIPDEYSFENRFFPILREKFPQGALAAEISSAESIKDIEKVIVDYAIDFPDMGKAGASVYTVLFEHLKELRDGSTESFELVADERIFDPEILSGVLCAVACAPKDSGEGVDMDLLDADTRSSIEKAETYIGGRLIERVDTGLEGITEEKQLLGNFFDRPFGRWIKRHKMSIIIGTVATLIVAAAIVVGVNIAQ